MGRLLPAAALPRLVGCQRSADRRSDQGGHPLSRRMGLAVPLRGPRDHTGPQAARLGLAPAVPTNDRPVRLYLYFAAPHDLSRSGPGIRLAGDLGGYRKATLHYVRNAGI